MTETAERNATHSTVKSDIVTVSHSPRLLDRVRERICVLHYSRSTEKTYIHWIFVIYAQKTCAILFSVYNAGNERPPVGGPID